MAQTQAKGLGANSGKGTRCKLRQTEMAQTQAKGLGANTDKGRWRKQYRA